jgi:hypothetical protein
MCGFSHEALRVIWRVTTCVQAVIDILACVANNDT